MLCAHTVLSPDDGHIVARNMYRLINTLRKIVHQIYLFTSNLQL